MSELLIPFGIHRNSGEIIEPEDAPRGRACQCLCPGCKAPLLSRHPKQNRYHFAHDSRHELARPQSQCPFNSALAVAMMIRNLTPVLVGRVVRTPRYQIYQSFDCCWTSSKSALISKSSWVKIDQADASVLVGSHRFDLALEIGGYSILIDLVYKGKPAVALQESDLAEAKAGVLEINCSKFSFASLKKDHSRRFSELVTDFVLKVGPRHWRYHPRQVVKLQAVRDRHQCPVVTSPVTLLPKYPKRTHSYSQRTQKPVRRYQPPPQPESVPVVNTNYHCVLCDRDWIHQSDRDLKCPGCDSHLYSRKVIP